MMQVSIMKVYVVSRDSNVFYIDRGELNGN